MHGASSARQSSCHPDTGDILIGHPPNYCLNRLVLYVDRERARRWTKQEVIDRWTVLFRAPTLVKRWQSGEALEAERVAAEAIIEGWRARLYDISWFMRCLNEHLARLANQEDDCTGRFWPTIAPA